MHQLDVHTSGNGEGDDERSTHQEVCLNSRMNPRLKVSIAGQNARRNQIVITKDLFDVWIERP
jgi:hypothetical protein